MYLVQPTIDRVSYSNNPQEKSEFFFNSLRNRFPNIKTPSKEVAPILGQLDLVNITDILGENAPVIDNLSPIELSYLNPLCRFFWHVKRFEQAVSEFELANPGALDIDYFKFYDDDVSVSGKSVEKSVLENIFIYKNLENAKKLVVTTHLHFSYIYKQMVDLGHEDMNEIYAKLFELPPVDDEADDFSEEIQYWCEIFLSYLFMAEKTQAIGVQNFITNPALITKKQNKGRLGVLSVKFESKAGFKIKDSKIGDVVTECFGYPDGYQQMKGSYCPEFISSNIGENLKREIASLEYYFNLIKDNTDDKSAFLSLKKECSSLCETIDSGENIHNDSLTELIARTGKAYYFWYAEMVSSLSTHDKETSQLPEKIKNRKYSELFEKLLSICLRLVAAFQPAVNFDAPDRPQEDDIRLLKLVLTDICRDDESHNKNSINSLAEAMSEGYGLDGFELAMELKDSYSWDLKRDDIDNLDTLIHKVDENMTRFGWIWAELVKPKATLAIGTSTSFGVIDGICDSFPASYLVKDPDEPDTDSSRRRTIISFEKIRKST